MLLQGCGKKYAPLLKQGENEIIIFETEGKVKDTIALKDEPDIG